MNDGGTGVQVTKSKPTPTTPRKERINAMGVVASADGKYLYFAVRQGPFSYNAQFPLWKIMRRDRKTGDEDTLIEQLESAFRPILSPDGSQLLYVTRYETESEALAAVLKMCEQSHGSRAPLGLIANGEALIAYGDALESRAREKKEEKFSRA